MKRTGDGALVEFRSVVDAVRCAIEIQTGMVERNAGVPREKRIEFRIGIHLGDIVEENDGDLMGDGVNIAARLTVTISMKIAIEQHVIVDTGPDPKLLPVLDSEGHLYFRRTECELLAVQASLDYMFA